MLRKKRGPKFEDELDKLSGPNMNRVNALDYNENDTSFDEKEKIGDDLGVDLVDKSFIEEEDFE